MSSVPVFGVIAPHPPIFVASVGGERTHQTRRSIDALQRAAHALHLFDPDTLVLMSPHAPALADAFLVDGAEQLSGSLGTFGDDRLRSYRGDPELASAIASEVATVGHAVALRSEDPRLQPGWLDHASIVPLDFLDKDSRYALVVVSLSHLGYHAHRDFGAAVACAAERIGRRVAFIASGDLSHRLTPDAPAGYSVRGQELDAWIIDRVAQGSLAQLVDCDRDLAEAGGECGLRSIIALGGYCGEDPAPVRKLSYEGPWGVGYLTALVGHAALESDDAARTPATGYRGGTPGADESEVVRLARRAIVSRVSADAVVSDAALAGAEYPERAGVFVSLHRHGDLRGCIGTIAPTQAYLGAEVVGNAVEAATNDPRFPSLSADELEDLEIKVDVLHAPEPAAVEDLDPAHFGVIVTSGWRRGLLLPDLDGVDDVDTQIAIALRKAGIGPKEEYALQRFQVDRYT
ncbi:MAG: AmmeMemoRadiSam system protein A [Coriobacteriia bacterium]|nr:AmmeMemoRadiSam system protein A [Coriobacteriia bacterium]